jgi:hypothetical protein
MKETKVKISIASLIVFVVLIGIFHFAPISISFGNRNVVESPPRDVSMKPNLWYYVCVKESHTLPANSECYTCSQSKHSAQTLFQRSKKFQHRRIAQNR